LQRHLLQARAPTAKHNYCFVYHSEFRSAFIYILFADRYKSFFFLTFNLFCKLTTVCARNTPGAALSFCSYELHKTFVLRKHLCQVTALRVEKNVSFYLFYEFSLKSTAAPLNFASTLIL